MRRNLSPEDLGDLLTQARVAVLATRRADGSPLLSPVWHKWEAGGFTFTTFRGDVKLRHIDRDPQVSILVAEDGPPYRGIEVRGRAAPADADGETTLRRLAEHYLAGRDVDGFMSKIREWMGDVGHTGIVALRVTHGALRAWDYSDEVW
jgi:PPOX class probable F420-dependent enzyme